MNRPVAVVLAAGNSSRLGEGLSKQLLRVEGKTLIERTICCLLDAQLTVHVILGADYAKHLETIQHLPVTIHQNIVWHRGMGSSIKQALQILQKESAILFTVCDQPKLSSSLIQEFVNKHLEDKSLVIAAQYQDTVGVPVLVPSSFYQRFLSMSDHEGGKSILRQISNISLVPFEDGQIDIDTLDEYQRYINRLT